MPIANAEKRRRYQRRWIKRQRDEWIASQGGACADCGRRDTLQMHHVDPTQKVSHRIWSWSKARRVIELAKCVVLCRRCHRMRHRLPTSRFWAVARDFEKNYLEIHPVGSQIASETGKEHAA